MQSPAQRRKPEKDLLESFSLVDSRIRRSLSHSTEQKRSLNNLSGELCSGLFSSCSQAIEPPGGISALHEVKIAHLEAVNQSVSELRALQLENDAAEGECRRLVNEHIESLDTQLEALIAEAAEQVEHIQKNEDIIKQISYRIGRATGDTQLEEKATQTWRYLGTPRRISAGAETKRQ